VIRAQRRDQLAAFLNENGIETAIHYPTPLPLLPAYAERGFSQEQFPVSSQYQHEILSLPIYPELSIIEIKHIANIIFQFYSPKEVNN
jgi:dTDP-4-amino-4,6-dideoxygalactose transaminase